MDKIEMFGKSAYPFFGFGCFIGLSFSFIICFVCSLFLFSFVLVHMHTPLKPIEQTIACSVL